MKLLLDNNLSHRLAERLTECFPQSSHVMTVGLDRASDLEVWQYAKSNGYTILTKDEDFNDLSLLRGFPPKVIWLRTGNSENASLERLLRSVQRELEVFQRSADERLFALYSAD